MWIDTSIPLYFKYESAAHGPIDRQRLEEMAVAALGPNGLDLSDDPRMKRRVTARTAPSAR